MNIITRFLNIVVPSQNTIANKTTKSTISDAYVTPQNQDSGSNSGNYYAIKSYGYITTKASSPGSLTVTINLGSTVLGTMTFSSVPVGLTNAGINLEVFIVRTATGSSGAYSCQGQMSINNGGTLVVASIFNSSTITINTRNPNNLAIAAQWSVADPTNSVTFAYPIMVEGN